MQQTKDQHPNILKIKITKKKKKNTNRKVYKRHK